MPSIKRGSINLYDTLRPITTSTGKRLERYHAGVGKVEHNWVDVQQNYASEIIPFQEFLEAQKALQNKYPLFNYECIGYNRRTKDIRFLQCYDFDTADEPKVTAAVIYSPRTTKLNLEYSHKKIKHKWLMVKDDYLGFNVRESYNKSKEKESNENK